MTNEFLLTCIHARKSGTASEYARLLWSLVNCLSQGQWLYSLKMAAGRLYGYPKNTEIAGTKGSEDAIVYSLRQAWVLG